MWVGLQTGGVEIIVHGADCEVLAELIFHYLRINCVETNNNQRGEA
jgi:hypothetical protein